MPDDLYDRDILTWSEHQADLLRRLAAGERVNEVDWPHVIEEIEDVGNTQLSATCGLLRQAMIHLLKIHLLPGAPSGDHWVDEIETFLDDAAERFVPSMRQKIGLEAIFRKARARAARHGGGQPMPLSCPWTLDDLLAGDVDTLLATLAKTEGTP